jgi:hypothetical protein
MANRFFSYLGQGILNFTITFLVYFGVRYVRPIFFSYLGTRNTNFSRPHFFFVLEFAMSDRFFLIFGNKEY